MLYESYNKQYYWKKEGFIAWLALPGLGRRSEGYGGGGGGGGRGLKVAIKKENVKRVCPNKASLEGCDSSKKCV